MYALLKDRRFALLALGHAVNGIGSWAALVAIWGYAVYRFDVGAAGVTLLMLAWGLPPVLVAPAAGVTIDRLGPKRVAIAGDLFGAAVSLTMIAAGSFGPLVALAALHGVAKGFSYPAYDALPGRLVDGPRLFEANALLSAAVDSSIILGPVVAAGAIAMWGTGAAFATDAVSYLVGAAVIVPLRLRAVAPSRRARAVDEAREGLRIVRSSPGATPLFVLSGAMWFSFGAFAVLEPLYARNVLHIPVTTFALLQTAFGIGLVGTGLTLPLVRRRLEATPALAAVVVAAGFAAALYGGTPFTVVAFMGVFLWGIAVGLFGAPARTLLMRATPEHAHGRVLATWRMGQQVAHLLPVLGAGAAAELASVQAALIGTGAVVVATGAATLLARPAPVPEPALAP